MAVRSPHQEFETLRIISGISTASKGPIRSTNNQWEKKKLPLIEVSLYRRLTGCKTSTSRIRDTEKL
ncbi:hypothetical protein FHP05_04495 [Cerasibacillus terrae]|uniref:Uncharacterized protein n=1 Tax=Cerasibacillus terrae TaxID=2498845 RepID=A0A5C8P0U6_9BACI|nr:hypothetical protein FHP05_04495 [Cerasibacillus terrae]